MSYENQYHLKIKITSDLQGWKLSDGLQKLWDKNSIGGQYDLVVFADQLDVIIRRQISDDASLIHVRLGQDINDSSVSSAAAEQVIAELVQYEPMDLISDEHQQIVDALRNGKFEILNAQELTIAELSVRDEVGQLFTGFINAAQNLTALASESDRIVGESAINGDVFVKMAQSLGNFAKHPGVIAKYGEFDGHPIHAAWAVFDSRSHNDKDDTFIVNVQCVDNLALSIAAYDKEKEKYKKDRQESELVE